MEQLKVIKDIPKNNKNKKYHKKANDNQLSNKEEVVVVETE